MTIFSFESLKGKNNHTTLKGESVVYVNSNRKVIDGDLYGKTVFMPLFWRLIF